MKTDQEMVRWALEESPEPIIKNPYLRSAFGDGQLVLKKANLVRKGDAVKNLNEKWTAERVEKAAKKIYGVYDPKTDKYKFLPDEELDAILNERTKRRKIDEHLTKYGKGLVESEARKAGWTKRTRVAESRILTETDIADIRKNLVKNNKKVAMVNHQFVFVDPKLQQEFLDDMILRYQNPRTSTKAVQAGYKTNAQLFEKYFKGTYSEKGVHDLISRFKNKLGLKFKKLPPGERNVDQLRRYAKLLISQAGKRITGLEAFPAHHLFPIGDEFAHGTQDFAIIDKKTNSQLSGPNKKLVYLAENRAQLIKDVSSKKISLTEFDTALAKLDTEAESIINNHYKKYPKHDGLLNWRKAGSVADAQGKYKSVLIKETIGGDYKKWSITNTDKKILDLSKEEIATFRSQVQTAAEAKVAAKTGTKIANILTKIKPLLKGTGWLLAGEAAIAPILALGPYARGKTWKRSASEALYGLNVPKWLGGWAQSEYEEIKENAGQRGADVWKMKQIDVKRDELHKEFNDLMQDQTTEYPSIESLQRSTVIQEKINQLAKEYTELSQQFLSGEIDFDGRPVGNELYGRALDALLAAEGRKADPEKGITAIEGQIQKFDKQRVGERQKRWQKVGRTLMDKPREKFIDFTLGPNWKKNLPQQQNQFYKKQYPRNPRELGQHLSSDTNLALFAEGGIAGLLKK